MTDHMTFSKTTRNFGIAQFTDIDGAYCTLQESSRAILAQPGAGAVWLGVGETRMHLDRERVKALIGALVEWLDSGSVQAGGADHD